MPAQLPDILFAVCALGMLALSLAVVLARNPVRATLLLILSFLPTALLYVMLRAPFVGVLQILVYAGAIMMLFVFIIMMINPAPKAGEVPDESLHPDYRNPPSLRRALLWPAFLALAAFALIPPVYRAASEMAPAAAGKNGFGSLHSLAVFLFKNPGENPLTVSFELISFLILVGILAAINFSRRRVARGPASPPTEAG